MIHAAELQQAIARENLKTSKRHAEHLVNLIEGTAGDNYGDVDEDGTVDDPGDGPGLLRYLQDLERVATEDDIISLIQPVRDQLRQVNATALSVIRASDLASVQSSGEEALTVADKASREGILQLEKKALDAGIRSIDVIVPQVPGEKREPNSVTVVIDQFQFINKTVIVEKGWSVVWINQEAPKHTVSSDDDIFESGTMGQGDTFTSVFDQIGEFPYYCKFHGDSGDVGMAGKIVVE